LELEGLREAIVEPGVAQAVNVHVLAEVHEVAEVALELPGEPMPLALDTQPYAGRVPVGAFERLIGITARPVEEVAVVDLGVSVEGNLELRRLVPVAQARPERATVLGARQPSDEEQRAGSGSRVARPHAPPRDARADRRTSSAPRKRRRPARSSETQSVPLASTQRPSCWTPGRRTSASTRPSSWRNRRRSRASSITTSRFSASTHVAAVRSPRPSSGHRARTTSPPTTSFPRTGSNARLSTIAGARWCT